MDSQSKEYQQKVIQYNQSLLTSIGNSRQQISKYLKQIFGKPLTQASIRKLSWTFSSHWDNDSDFRNHATSLLSFEGSSFPFPIATSKQAQYHHNHFIQAFLLSLMYPQVDVLQVQVITATALNPCRVGSTDTTERLEEMDKLYLHLSSLIPDTHKQKQRITLEILYDEIKIQSEKLDEIVNLLEANAKAKVQKKTNKKTTR